MKKLSKRKKRLLRRGALILLVLLIVGLAVVLLKWYDSNHGVFDGSGTEDVLEYQGEEYVRNNEIETLLVLGLDKYSYDVDNSSYANNQQADFVMLLVFNNTEKTFSAIHINRDTMTDINVLGVAGQKIDTVNGQLALSYAYGKGGINSCHNTEDSVSEILCGLDINSSVAVNMDAVPDFNDLVGGVEVLVEDDFSEIDESLKMGEKVTLKGEQALNYVRSRYDLEDSTNGRRMERQRQYLNALYAKTKSCIEQDDEFALKVVEVFDDRFVSEEYHEASRQQQLIEKITDYEFTGIVSLNGEIKKGEEFIEFYPDENAVKELVVNTFYKLKE